MILSTRICTASLYNRDLLSDQPPKNYHKLSVNSQLLKQFCFVSLYTISLPIGSAILHCTVLLYSVFLFISTIFISPFLCVPFSCFSCHDSVTPVFFISFFLLSPFFTSPVHNICLLLLFVLSNVFQLSNC